MVGSSKSLAFMVVAAATAAQVNGHGYMSDPAVTFISTAGDPTQFIATIESSASGFSGTFNSDPATNTASFTKAFASSKYTSLKEMVTDLGQLISTTGVTITCGLTDPDETAQPLPSTYVEWAHSSSEGFTASHEGPCEIWCDNTRVFQDDDCAAHYTTAPAQLPYDSASCSGASRLTFYWLALHSSTWQVYINCAALESGSSTSTTSTSTTASSSTGSTTSTSTSTSTSTTTAPSTTSATPTVTSASSTTTTSSSSTGTTTSSATGTSSSSNNWGSSTTTTAPSTSTGSTSTNTWGSSTTTTAPSTSTGSKSTESASNSWGNWGTSSGNQGGTWNGGMSFGFN